MTRTATLDASASLMTDIHAHLRACEAATKMQTIEFHLRSANALIDGVDFQELPENVQEEIFERYAGQLLRVQPIGV